MKKYGVRMSYFGGSVIRSLQYCFKLISTKRHLLPRYLCSKFQSGNGLRITANIIIYQMSVWNKKVDTSVPLNPSPLFIVHQYIVLQQKDILYSDIIASHNAEPLSKLFIEVYIWQFIRKKKQCSKQPDKIESTWKKIFYLITIKKSCIKKKGILY